jgi:hypothetical protein
VGAGLPRAHLPWRRRAQAPVQTFCAQRGIPYSETRLLPSYAQVLHHLDTTGRKPGPEPVAKHGHHRSGGPLNRAMRKTPCGPRLQMGAY